MIYPPRFYSVSNQGYNSSPHGHYSRPGFYSAAVSFLPLIETGFFSKQAFFSRGNRYLAALRKYYKTYSEHEDWFVECVVQTKPIDLSCENPTKLDETSPLCPSFDSSQFGWFLRRNDEWLWLFLSYRMRQLLIEWRFCWSSDRLDRSSNKIIDRFIGEAARTTESSVTWRFWSNNRVVGCVAELLIEWPTQQIE